MFIQKFNAAAICKSAKKQQGVSLIELLIAMGLAILIISGVVRMLAHSISKSKLIDAEVEIQETLMYSNNRFSFIFKEALASPCGDIRGMLANTVGGDSQLKVAHLRSTASLMPQNIPNIILQPNSQKSNNIQQDEFPMIVAGIEGHVNEMEGQDGLKFSTKLNNIVPGSEYVIVMEISEKIVLATPPNKVGAIRGGKNSGRLMKDRDSIPTSTIIDGVGGTDVPFIITDCKHADIFLADSTPTPGSVGGTNREITSNSIPVANNLYFNADYKPKETILSPVRFSAYYVATDSDGNRNLAQYDLVSDTSQNLVAGVNEIKFTWGLGLLESASKIQSYFTTEDLLTSGITVDGFRNNVLSAEVKITATSVNNVYRKPDGAPLDRTVTRNYTIRNKMERM